MEIRPTEPSETSDNENTSPSPNDRFVIALGQSPKIRTDGVSAILELLEWRYQLAETVLFHRTKLSAAAMLDRALFELWEDETDDKIIDAVLELSDEQLIDESIRIAKARDGNDVVKLRMKVAAENLNRIKHRNLFKELKTWGVDGTAKTLREKVRKTYGAGSEDPKKAAAARTQALRELESDFKIRPGSLAMYSVELKPKIAEVSIAVEGVIKTLADYEHDEDDPLSGGHLSAQIKRFKRLWRVHFFIERNEKKRLQDNGLLGTLINAIEALVLGNCDDPKAAARDIAHAIAGNQNSGWHGTKVLDLPAEAARSSGERGNIRGYPHGAPSIRGFFAKGDNSGK
jgi:hypothetical protein